MEKEIKNCRILIKRRVAGEAGPPPTLSWGEIALNETNQTLYIGTTESPKTSHEEALYISWRRVF